MAHSLVPAACVSGVRMYFHIAGGDHQPHLKHPWQNLSKKNANGKKSGAGQYFTPRVLIDVMTRLVEPQPKERCNDPACGTFGFMTAAHQYVAAQIDDFFDLDADTAAFERTKAFTGTELVHDTHHLALMNAMLHDMEGEIVLGDTLSNLGKGMRGYDVVLPTLCEASHNVGKTVTTVNLGIGLARQGKRVLLVDVDPQGSLTASLGYHQPDQLDKTLSTVLGLV